jgi:hypothetical protein
VRAGTTGVASPLAGRGDAGPLARLFPPEPIRNTLMRINQGSGPALNIHAHRNRLPTSTMITQSNQTTAVAVLGLS